MSYLLFVDFPRYASSFCMAALLLFTGVQSVGFEEIVVQQIYHHPRYAAVNIPCKTGRLAMMLRKIFSYLAIYVVYRKQLVS